MNEFDPWKQVSNIEDLITNCGFSEAETLAVELPEKFLHKDYLLSIIYKENGRHQESYQHALEAWTSCEDETLVKLYLSNLFECIWVEEMFSLEFLSPFKSQHDRSPRYSWPSISPKEISLDKGLLGSLNEELLLFGSELDHEPNIWNLVNQTVSEEIYSGKNGIALDPIIGTRGMKNPTLKDVVKYLSYITKFDDATWDIDQIAGGLESILLTDLGSFMDVSLLRQYVTKQLGTKSKAVKILEIGGGYGRLAESILRNLTIEVDQYILADSVPISLASAYAYLRESFPEFEVSILLRDQPISQTSRIMIIPSWNLSLSPIENVDLVINIESFQEMTKGYVDHWLRYIELIIGSERYVYFSNSKDYLNRNIPEIPRKWKKILEENTPRSWTNNHPTSIYQVE